MSSDMLQYIDLEMCRSSMAGALVLTRSTAAGAAVALPIA